ncbi:MAG: S9 family peptidase [Betaproteobacteria bacterium]|nr:S9 family peptidase [Betaproteobacteria bacterium]
MKLRSITCLSVLSLLLLISEVVLAAPLPIETLFQRAKYGGARLSPSGKSLAVLTPVNDRLNIAIIDLEARKSSLLTSTTESDVINVNWLTDERLVFSLGDIRRGTGEAPRRSDTLTINRDGKDARSISQGFMETRKRSVSLFRTIPDSDEIFITARERDAEQLDIYRLNSKTGRKTLITFESPGKASNWVMDVDNVPRAVVTQDLDGDRAAWYVRKDASSPWKLVREAKLNALKSSPEAFSTDGKTLYVSSREDRDRTAIYEYDIDSGKFSDPIIQHPERDIDGDFLTNLKQRKLLGFTYQDDQPSQVWFDEEYAKMQKAIDAALPDTVNRLQKARDGDRWLITAFADNNPGTAYLFDSKNRKLEKVFDFSPWVKPNEMAKTKWIRYPARDGLTIPAMLTLPPGVSDKKVPLIVDIHGGPYVPATNWGYSPDVQFLASRGYAVLQPQFRGTDGFGYKHFSAGFRKWGDEMQDDLEDGVKYLAAQGIIDSNRVCFYGASYGGYAAMWGAIKNKDLIKCAVAFVGVSSIDYLFDNAQTDVARLVDRSSQTVVQIGDPKTERARFKRVNPLDNADKVGVPILLAYGAEDLRVPLVHGTDFKKALDKNGKTYEFKVYEGEGHGFNKTENVIDFNTRVEKFLAKYLSNP